MKSCISVFAIGSVLLACAATGTLPDADKSDAVGPPSNKRVLPLLLKNAVLPLSRGVHCKSAATSPDDVSLGDYLAGPAHGSPARAGV